MTTISHEKVDLSVTMEKAASTGTGLGALVPLPFLLLFGLIWGWAALGDGLDAYFSPFWQFWLVLLGMIVVHELLHGLTWMIAGRKRWSAMKFGMQWKSLTPYAHSTEPMAAWAYRVGTLMPGLLLGIVPMVISVVTGNGWLLFFGAIATLAAGGDMLILWLLRGVPGHRLVEDHPTQAGCLLLPE